MLKELYPGTTGSMAGPFAVLGDRLYFGALTPGTGHELWRTDGTPEGTALAADVNPGAAGSGGITSGASVREWRRIGRGAGDAGALSPPSYGMEAVRCIGGRCKRRASSL